jgi:hypothetical protein
MFTVLAIAAMVAGLAAQDNDAFRRGMQARDDEQWTVVAQRMREAIAQRPQESTERVGARLGLGGNEYLPHYFLGEALFRSGDCAGAVNAWAISERQGVVQKVRNGEFGRDLRNGYTECEKKGVLPPAKLDPALNALSQQLTEINGVANSVLGLVKQNEEVWRSDANFQGQYEKGRAEIDTARKAYEAARNSRLQRELEQAAAAIGRARPIFVTVEANFNAAIASRQTAQGLMREVGEAIGLAEALSTAIDSKKVPFTPSMTSTHQGGRESLGRARERLIEGQKTLNPQTLSVARSAATEAQTRFRQVLEEIARVEKDSAQRQVNEALTRTLEAFSLLDTATATLDRFLSERPGVLPADKEAERKAAQDQVARARRRLDQARRSDNLGTIADAARLANEARDRLTLLIGTFGPVTLRDRGVHEALEQGARHYFNGEYQQAAAALAAGEALETDVALRLHFHLLRAAALYELFLRSGGTDERLQAQASEEVRHSKSIDSAFQPDARAFSPRFLTFYQSVNPPSPAPAAPQVVPPAAPAEPQP